MPTSVVIAAMIGFVIGFTTNILMAISMGLFFSLVMWAITGFKFNKSENNSDQFNNILNPFPKKISPHDVGVGLAVMLDTSCPVSSISKEEENLLQEMGLSVAQYHQEIIALCASAQECAVMNSRISKEIKEEILDSYREAWENVKNANARGAATHRLFQKRRLAYLSAFSEDLSAFNEDGRDQVGTRITFTFCNAITEYVFDASKNGFGYMLSVIRADSSFMTHVELSRVAIEKQVC